MLVERPALWWAHVQAEFEQTERAWVLDDVAWALPTPNRQQYRGLSRYPFLSAPADDAELDLLIGAGLRHLREHRAARQELSRIGREREENPAWIPDIDALRRVTSLLERDHPYEPICLGRADWCRPSLFVGFDVAYSGPDFTSLIADLMICPRWSHPSSGALEDLRAFASVLNENSLFGARSEAADYLRWCGEQVWLDSGMCESSEVLRISVLDVPAYFS